MGDRTLIVCGARMSVSPKLGTARGSGSKPLRWHSIVLEYCWAKPVEVLSAIAGVAGVFLGGGSLLLNIFNQSNLEVVVLTIGLFFYAATASLALMMVMCGKFISDRALAEAELQRQKAEAQREKEHLTQLSSLKEGADEKISELQNEAARRVDQLMELSIVAERANVRAELVIKNNELSNRLIRAIPNELTRLISTAFEMLGRAVAGTISRLDERTVETRSDSFLMTLLNTTAEIVAIKHNVAPKDVTASIVVLTRSPEGELTYGPAIWSKDTRDARTASEKRQRGDGAGRLVERHAIYRALLEPSRLDQWVCGRQDALLDKIQKGSAQRYFEPQRGDRERKFILVVPIIGDAPEDPSAKISRDRPTRQYIEGNRYVVGFFCLDSLSCSFDTVFDLSIAQEFAIYANLGLLITELGRSAIATRVSHEGYGRTGQASK